jgi:hypothetical protein
MNADSSAFVNGIVPTSGLLLLRTSTPSPASAISTQLPPLAPLNDDFRQLALWVEAG